ncbi:MAG: hypothetical protein HYU02_02110 [Thaumarchaeota archaeon]|nr:hypothetical protein [Nitrososphaerota archaeon]
MSDRYDFIGWQEPAPDVPFWQVALCYLRGHPLSYRGKFGGSIDEMFTQYECECGRHFAWQKPRHEKYPR